MRVHFIKALLIFTAGVGFLVLPPNARAQTVDPDARSVLVAMSSYLGGLKSFSVETFTVDEVITVEGQKLQYLHSGEVVLQRPDKLYIARKGAAGGAGMLVNEKGLTVVAKEANAYLQLDASSIDAAIDVMRGLGFDAPGADLLATKPLDDSTTDITSGAHMGMTTIDGLETHQLAFRGKDVDWQLWVTTGDKPLPLRYVITSKSAPGALQYTLELRNWNVAPQIDATRFVFEPPQGAKKLNPTSISVNAVGDMTIKGE